MPMKNVMFLRSKNFLTEQQVLTAARYARDPSKFKLAPTLGRALNDLIIRDVPIEAYERERGWPIRSAKLLLSQMLYALEESYGMFVEAPNEKSLEQIIEEQKEMIDYLVGEDPEQVCAVIEEFDLTPYEAKFFTVMHNSIGRLLSKETILRRIYHGRSADEHPYEKIVDVYVCKVRKKVSHKFLIQTVWGEGYRLVPNIQAKEAA